MCIAVAGTRAGAGAVTHRRGHTAPAAAPRSVRSGNGISRPRRARPSGRVHVARARPPPRPRTYETF